MYRWWNFLETCTASTKKVLRLNLDETAVRFYYRPRKGLVAGRRDWSGHLSFSVTQKASRGDQRKALTLP